MTPASPAGAAPTISVVQPATIDDAATLLRDTRGSVLFRGAGTAEAWGGRPQVTDLVIETAGIAALLRYSPADMTASVQAGMPLSELQRIVGEHRQWLALDPPGEATGATVGGLLASGDSGPRRLRYGSLRDLVIGVTLVLPDGTVAHAGGNVIKNVAGYDLAKLIYGSLGTLALIAEVTVRLHPRPDRSASLTATCPVGTATAITGELLAAAVEPSAVEWFGEPGSLNGVLAIRYEGSPAAVTAQVAETRARLSAIGVAADNEATADEEVVLWQRSVAFRAPLPEETILRAGTRPSDLPAAAAALMTCADAAGCRATLASQAALGLHTARLTGPIPAQAVCLGRWRDEVAALGGNLLVQSRPDTLDGLVDVLGPPPSEVNLLRALAQGFDPERRCAPGRFGSWY